MDGLCAQFELRIFDHLMDRIQCDHRGTEDDLGCPDPIRFCENFMGKFLSFRARLVHFPISGNYFSTHDLKIFLVNWFSGETSQKLKVKGQIIF
jgi:hypothetical protein